MGGKGEAGNFKNFWNKNAHAHNSRDKRIHRLNDAVQGRVAADGHGEATHVVVDRTDLRGAMSLFKQHSNNNNNNNQQKSVQKIIF